MNVETLENQENIQDQDQIKEAEVDLIEQEEQASNKFINIFSRRSRRSDSRDRKRRRSPSSSRSSSKSKSKDRK